MTWAELQTLLNVKATAVADEFYITSLEQMEQDSFEFDGTVICLDVTNLNGTKNYTARGTVQDNYPLEIYFIQNQETDDNEGQINTIFSACNEVATEFLYNLNQVGKEILPIENARFERVRNLTGNIWAGCLLSLTIVTECNR